ncbi:MAG: molybdopterin-dependent oxidoreductase, partial [Deltaproteobacteria bacterium]|nr:molybdopterin-dependent oxidoreductase [Deltaproteobacteria bacterium]
MSAEKQETRVVGRSVEKVDGLSLATGAARFVADDLPRGTLFAALLGSPHAHARIRSIDASEARAMPEVRAVLTWQDVPRVAWTTAGQGHPEPSPYDAFCLDHKVRFVGDRVAAVAATTPEAARRALEAIRVEYEVLPAVFDPQRAMDPGAPVIHDEPEARMVIPATYDPSRNLAASVAAHLGDVEAVLAASDAVVEGEYRFHQVQHCPMEPHVVLTLLDERGRLEIRTSTQVPFHVRRIVAARLQLPAGRIHVIKPRIGGGFGSKQEVLLEDVCAALTLATGRPVLLEYTRAEEFVASRTRHPMILTLRTGATRDGQMTGIDLKVLLDTGAYGAHALTVASNAGSKTLPLYRWQALRFQADAVYTNKPVAGAHRGYGATQAYFALEAQVDELAARIGLDPLEFRRRNHIRSGESSPVFEALGEGGPGVAQSIGSCGLPACLDRGAEAIGWATRRGRTQTGVVRRGVGMACLMQGSSIPGVDMGAAWMKLNDDGSFNLHVGATDLGTGSDTVLSQIAAEVLTVGVDRIILRSSDTDTTPFDVGAYASSTTYLSGHAVRKVAEDVRGQIRRVGARILRMPVEMVTVSEGAVVGPGDRRIPFDEVALHSLYREEQHQIQAVASHVTGQSPPPFSAHFAEVEVDTETGDLRVVRYVAAVDCGVALNPRLAEGQTEGAVLNGISHTLSEQYHYDDKGRVLNPDFTGYKIYTALDLPEITTILVEAPEPSGPFGAKSISEIGINGPAPAIANAIFDA